MQAHPPAGRLPGVLLVLFCGLGASRWMLEASLPPELSPVDHLLGGCVLAFVVAALTDVRAFPRLFRDRLSWRAAAWTAMMLGVPALLLQAVSTLLGSDDAASGFAGAPVLICFFAALGPGSGGVLGSTGSALPAALAGLAGTLMLLPTHAPASAREGSGALVLLLALACSAWASVRLHPVLQSLPVRRGLIAGAGGAALLLLGARAFAGTIPHAAQASRGDLAAILAHAAGIALLLPLARALPPVPLSSRFLLVPLLAAVEGALWLRPTLTTRALLGTALMAGGAVLLLRHKLATHDDEPLSLR